MALASPLHLCSWLTSIDGSPCAHCGRRWPCDDMRALVDRNGGELRSDLHVIYRGTQSQECVRWTVVPKTVASREAEQGRT